MCIPVHVHNCNDLSKHNHILRKMKTDTSNLVKVSRANFIFFNILQRSGVTNEHADVKRITKHFVIAELCLNTVLQF